MASSTCTVIAKEKEGVKKTNNEGQAGDRGKKTLTFSLAELKWFSDVCVEGSS